MPGTLLLLPVRLVLWGIHGVERAVARTFDFSANSGWIAVLAAGVGAGIVLLGLAAVRVARRVRSS